MLEPRRALARMKPSNLEGPVTVTGFTPVQLPAADVLVIAGDYCRDFRGGETAGARQQLEWLRQEFVPFLIKQPYKKIVVVSGNHDWVHYVDETKKAAQRLLEAAGITYLCDESFEFEGVKFYGSPWQPWFFDWAFNLPKMDPSSGYPEARRTWAKIPSDAHVVITHGPAKDLLDLAPGDRRVGCPILRERLLMVKPKLHLCGHIHGGYGQTELNGVKFGNVSLCDEEYQPVNPVQIFEV